MFYLRAGAHVRDVGERDRRLSPTTYNRGILTSTLGQSYKPWNVNYYCSYLTLNRKAAEVELIQKKKKHYRIWLT